MAAFDAVSFSFFEGKGFKRCTGGTQRELGVVANRRNVVDWVDAAAAGIRSQISAELKGRMFNIIIDAASRFGHSVLGITSQVIENRKFKHRCLAMVPLTDRHTAVNLADEVQLALAVYDLSISQVSTIGLDNAKNVTKCGDFLSEAQQDQLKLMAEEFGKSNQLEEEDLTFAGYGKQILLQFFIRNHQY